MPFPIFIEFALKKSQGEMDLDGLLQEREILDLFPESKGLSLVREDKREAPVMKLNLKHNVPFLTFPKLSKQDCIQHLFSVRAGGVSEGQFCSMNFSSKLGDDKDRVLENFRRIALAMDCKLDDMIGTVQTHTTNILRVTAQDKGKGILKDPDLWDLDGLVTNEKGVTLVAYMADCVPLFFADPVQGAVGVAHSGWRGTVNNMAGKMVERFQTEFGSDPKDLIVGIGPSICQACYEVDWNVAKEFQESLGDDTAERRQIAESGVYPMEGKDDCKLRRVAEPGDKAGKFQLDLWLANLIFLVRAGIDLKNVDVTDLCTSENSRLLFSHRASQGKRGNMGAFIKLCD